MQGQLALFSLLLCGLVAAVAMGGEAPLAGKKAVFIIAPKNFRDEELQEPTALLREQGCTVTLACSSLEPAKGMLGAKVKPDILLKDLKVAEYDAVVFIGGSGSSVYFDDPTAHAIAKEAAAKEKILAAICIAPSTLARAGVLKGKRATAWASQEGDLTKYGARWSEEPAERDGKLITANGPKSARRFGEFLAKALAETPKP
jgi:protease I